MKPFTSLIAFCLNVSSSSRSVGIVAILSLTSIAFNPNSSLVVLYVKFSLIDSIKLLITSWLFNE